MIPTSDPLRNRFDTHQVMINRELVMNILIYQFVLSYVFHYYLLQVVSPVPTSLYADMYIYILSQCS